MTDVIESIAQEGKGVRIRWESGASLFLSRALWREWPFGGEGAPVSPEEAESYFLPLQYSEALEYAVRLLAMRDHACGEVRRKLQARLYLPQAIERVMDKLIREQLLDDAAFAAKWAAYRARSGVGRARILQELRQKGVEGRLAERAVALDEAGQAQAKDAAVALACKLLRRYRDDPPNAAMRKLLSAMARRGYAYDESVRAVERAMAQEN